MKTKNIQAKLKKTEIQNKLKNMGIKHIEIVGSYSTNKQTTDSDIDLIYEKIDPQNFSLLEKIEVKQYLENLFNKKVDLINPKKIPQFIKNNLLSTKIKVF